MRMPCQSLWRTVKWNVCCSVELLGRAMANKKKKTGKTRKPGPARRAAAKSPRLSAGEWFEKLAAVQARLRAPDGCPWDREQTHASLRTYLIEEAYEVLEAMESGDDGKFAEEMGDLLLQIVFHSEIAKEEGRFDVSDVIREVHDKMVRRHPHVFGEKRAKDSAEVLKNWEQIKKEERIAAGKKTVEGARREDKAASLLDGVSKALPAALEGFQLTRRAARIGFDWDNVEGVFDKLSEEGDELREAVNATDAARIEEEMGDLLFAAVNLARFLHIDPEIALKKANAKFSSRFRRMEGLAARGGKALADVPRENMEEFWETAKGAEKTTFPKSAEARKA
jgi:tetrapyrrole methylase family protein/MazG family protein